MTTLTIAMPDNLNPMVDDNPFHSRADGPESTVDGTVWALMANVQFLDSKAWVYARSNLLQEVAGEFQTSFLPVTTAPSPTVVVGAMGEDESQSARLRLLCETAMKNIERNRQGERMGDNTRLYGKCKPHEVDLRKNIQIMAQDIRRFTSPYSAAAQARDEQVLGQLRSELALVLLHQPASAPALQVSSTAHVGDDEDSTDSEMSGYHSEPPLFTTRYDGRQMRLGNGKNVIMLDGQPLVPMTIGVYQRFVQSVAQRRHRDLRRIKAFGHELQNMKNWWSQWHGPDKVYELVQRHAHENLIRYQEQYPQEVAAELGALWHVKS